MYETTDIGLAAALIYSGVTLRDTLGNPRVSFVFDDTPEIQDMVEKYFNRELMVDAQTYMFTLKSLKARLYSIKDRK